MRAGKCLKGCNGQTRRVKAVFQWAADHELVPDSVPLNLQALRNLKHGEAPTPPRKQAVSDELVRQTCQHLPQEAVDIINVLRHSGARSGELYQLRVKDLQMASKDLWIYQPAKHKNAHRGHARTILFGPQSLAILKRLVKGRRPEDHVFVRPTWDDPRNRNRHTVGQPWSRYALGSLIARTCKPRRRHGGCRAGADGPCDDFDDGAVHYAGRRTRPRAGPQVRLMRFVGGLSVVCRWFVGGRQSCPLLSNGRFFLRTVGRRMGPLLHRGFFMLTIYVLFSEADEL